MTGALLVLARELNFGVARRMRAFGNALDAETLYSVRGRNSPSQSTFPPANCPVQMEAMS